MENYIYMSGWDYESMPEQLTVFHHSNSLVFNTKGELLERNTNSRKLYWKNLPLAEKNRVLNAIKKAAPLVQKGYEELQKAITLWNTITGDEPDDVYDEADLRHKAAWENMYNYERVVNIY